jgi:hypothetical protein
VISGGTSSVTALPGSTEEEQFSKKPAAKAKQMRPAAARGNGRAK